MTLHAHISNREGLKPMTVNVDPADWVTAAREAAYGLAVHFGASVTITDPSDNNAKVVTVTIEYHDE